MLLPFQLVGDAVPLRRVRSVWDLAGSFSITSQSNQFPHFFNFSVLSHRQSLQQQCITEQVSDTMLPLYGLKMFQRVLSRSVLENFKTSQELMIKLQW